MNIFIEVLSDLKPKRSGVTPHDSDPKQRCISTTTEAAAAAQSDAILYFLVFSGALVPIPFEMLWSEADHSSKTSYKYT